MKTKKNTLSPSIIKGFNEPQLFMFFKSVILIWKGLKEIPFDLAGTFYFHGFLLFGSRLIEKINLPQQMRLYKDYVEIFHKNKHFSSSLAIINCRELTRDIVKYEEEKLSKLKKGDRYFEFLADSLDQHRIYEKYFTMCEKWDRVFKSNQNISDCRGVLLDFFAEYASDKKFFAYPDTIKYLALQCNGNLNYLKALITIMNHGTIETWLPFSEVLVKITSERNKSVLPKVIELVETNA